MVTFIVTFIQAPRCGRSSDGRAPNSNGGTTRRMQGDASPPPGVLYWTSGIHVRERAMEPFTVVIVIGWALLMGTFVGMYFLDQKVKDQQSKSAKQ